MANDDGTSDPCRDHPYRVGDRVQIIAGGRLPGTITSIGWERGGAFIHVRLDRDRDAGQEGVYKFSCNEFVECVGAVDLLAEIVSCAEERLT